MGGLCPQTSYQVSVFCKKIAIFSISIIENMDFTSMWVLERSCLFKMFAPNICTNIFNHDFIRQKKASASGDCFPKDPYQMLYFLHIL